MVTLSPGYMTMENNIKVIHFPNYHPWEGEGKQMPICPNCGSRCIKYIKDESQVLTITHMFNCVNCRNGFREIILKRFHKENIEEEQLIMKLLHEDWIRNTQKESENVTGVIACGFLGG